MSLEPQVEFLKPEAPLPEKTLEEAAEQFITAEVPNVEAVLKAARGCWDSEFREEGLMLCPRASSIRIESSSVSTSFLYLSESLQAEN